MTSNDIYYVRTEIKHNIITIQPILHRYIKIYGNKNSAQYRPKVGKVFYRLQIKNNI